MAVLERPELEASPLADLHAIADQIGLDGFRRLRKADLVDAILGEKSDSPASTSNGSDDEEESPRPRRRRSPRARRAAGSAAKDESADEADATSDAEAKSDADSGKDADESSSRTSTSSGARRARGGRSARGGAGRSSSTRSGSASDDGEATDAGDSESTGRIAAGVVEVLGNGSAFLRVDPPEPSDDDVYISAAQVRRCELVSGDRVTGPVRTPRRSERYPSLVRIDTINGTSADAVSDGGRYEDLPVSWPSERLALDSKDATLEAIEWLTPLGLGSRAVIVGARHAGKSETLRRLLDALNGRENLELSLVLAGARPEEIAQWQEGSVAPVASLGFAASSDSQGQAIERAIDAAKRVAARGGNALVLIDGLDGISQHAARKALSAARNLRDGGSLTIVATASQPVGGETTVIALKSTGRQPIVDLVGSGTLRPELLVGDDGAEAIAKARVEAAE